MRKLSARRLSLAIAAFGVALQLAACGGGSQGSPPTPSATPVATQLWILQGPGLEAQAMATDPEGIKFFSNPSIRVMYPAVANVSPPSSWNVVLWHKYASFANFESDIQNGTVPAGTQVVGYDTESWSYTPANEQRDPIGYTIKFAQLAHQHGYSMIATPSEDLMKAFFPGQDKFSAFISYGIARAVAPYVDYYEIQAQDLETSPSSYSAYVQTIVGQVHSANAGVIIAAGLSTNVPNQPQIAPTAIDLAIGSSSNLVSGYWLNIVGATTGIASAALVSAP